MAEDINEMGSLEGIKSFAVKYRKPDCILLDSAYCSMGRMIGMKACEASGYTYHDINTLLELVHDSSITKNDLHLFEEHMRIHKLSREQMMEDTSIAKILQALDKAIQIALSKGPCLVHDCTVKEVLTAYGYSCITVFTYSNSDMMKIERAKVSPLYDSLKDQDVLLKKIQEEDQIRKNLHHALSDTEWGSTETYDLIMNTDYFGREYCIQLLAHIMNAQ